MFSLLSQGYGTYDGTAKKDAQERQEHKDYFSLEDVHLPPIGSNYRPPEQTEVPDDHIGPTYENKLFKLPKVDNIKQNLISVPKTYTTRKGALLLYAEDFFLPGSPKPKKRRCKLRKQPSVKLKTIGDLRNYILDYSNGGDPLFLALLQKRLSGYKDQSVRPGFSPKRYIANLGNSLEEKTWNRLAATGSLKDPTLLTYNPKDTSVHRDGAVCSLFPDKPQPYSTMSLPPFSPSSSMFESSFHFYKNGMSTGAASMISLNSETEEYAPSSRALSPEESLSNRLSEVEFLPQRKDFYTQLNAKQKEDLISQLLLQKTLESINSDLSDLQGWVANYPNNVGGVEIEQDSAFVVNLPKSKSKHRGSLKSGSLTSIPRLPPIQSAGAQPSTPVELKEESPLPQLSTEVSVHQQREFASGKEETGNILDPGSIHVDLMSSLDESSLSGYQTDLPQGDEDIINSEEVVKGDDSELHEDQTKHASQFPINEKSQETKHLDDVQGDETEELDMCSDSEESISNQGIVQNDAVIGLDDIILSEDTIRENEHHRSQDEEMKGVTAERADREEVERIYQNYSEPQGQVEEAKLHPSETESDGEDEGIGLDGNELDGINRRGEELIEEQEELNQAADRTAIMEEGSQSTHQVQPPPPISLEELQGEAHTVANRVLSRPQSGMVFMEDVRSAIAMWADRLTNLLGPPKQDARVSSASHQRSQLTGLAAQRGSNRLTRHRKVSRSAGPSLPALRKALKISGEEMPEIEALRNLPPLPERFYRPGQAQPPSGGANEHTYHEKLKNGSATTKGSSASGAAGSISWERVSNADVKVDIFSYAKKDKEPSFERIQANEIDDVESEEEDEEFKRALSAVVTEVQQDYTLIEAKSRMELSSPNKLQKPFQFPRPEASKPPAGLQNKKSSGQVKGKAKVGPPKRAVAGKKKAGKKPAKQQSKPSNKSAKSSEGKVETQNKDNHQEIANDVNETTITGEDKPEPVRVDSETGEHEPGTSDRTVVSSALSRVTSSRVSSKASDEFNESKNDLPSDSSATPVPEFPFLIPKPPEPQTIQQEPEIEQAPEPVEQKPVQESKAARRAAERAAAAERRRQEVERKRREREEAKKRAIEEETRLEQLRLEAEEDMKKREEERRQRRQEKEEAKQREYDDELEQERLANMKAERECRAREDWKKRQQQVLAYRKLEEDMRKEQEKIEAELEAARLREEEERIKAMEESERVVFLEKLRREEEELRRKLEEEKRKEEEQRRVREVERRQREEALALLRQKQLQRHLFIAGILKESHYLSLCQRLTKAFTFSYFDLIPWNHLQHLKPPPSPVRDLLRSVKENIPPTIVEEDEVTED